MFVRIVDDVRNFLKNVRGMDVVVDAGVEARPMQTNFGKGGAKRVVFTPSNDIQIIAPIFIGDNPRHLLDTKFIYEVAFAGYDPENKSDIYHRHICYDLWEAVTQALQRAYAGQYEWLNAQWSVERKHIIYGAELIATLSLNIPLSDLKSPEVIVGPRPGEPKPA